jgi:hypothetical protein
MERGQQRFTQSPVVQTDVSPHVSNTSFDCLSVSTVFVGDRFHSVTTGQLSSDSAQVTWQR